MRIVIDTNILIKAVFHDDSHAQGILRCVINDNLELAISEQIVNEYTGVYIEHLKKAPEIDLTKIYPFVRLVAHGTLFTITRSFNVFKDEYDNKFYDCAYEAEVDYIVSYDPHVYDSEQPLINKAGQTITPLSSWQLLQELKGKKYHKQRL
jgi:putative PIN family toxin of toxin-antitoxin system